MLKAASLVVLLAAPSAAAREESRVQAAAAQGRFAAAASAFEELERRGVPGAQASYWAGAAYMRLHLFGRARRAFARAQEPGWEPRPEWPPLAGFLARLDAIDRNSPPPAPVPGAAFDVFSSSPTAWTAPVLAALPEFSRVGLELYGKALPRVSFYLFSDRGRYLSFYRAAFDQDLATGWQDGTGNTHIVVYGETPQRPAGEPETVGNVLHEFGHAWANTYLREKRDLDYLDPHYRCPYADEGLADYVAARWDKGLYGRRRGWLAQEKIAKGATPPLFEELKGYDSFYRQGDVDTHYWLSALLVERLLGPQGGAKLPEYLDALAKLGDATKALAKVSGKDPRKEYQALVQELWEGRP